MLEGRTVGMIGAGNMAEALLRGLLGTGVVHPARCIVTNRSNDERLARLAREWGVRTTRDKALLMSDGEVIILAVKPPDMPTVLDEIAPHVHPRHLVISVAAGVPIEVLEHHLVSVPVVRTMPNTSTAVRASVTAIASGRLAGDDHLAIVREIFEAVGWVTVLPEPFLDVVTALSGSGPAYVYMLAEAMVEAGERAGLPSDVARAMVAYTVLGAGKMLAETGDAPEALRRRVTSPGGTTMAGVQALEEGGVREAVHTAIVRATRRARELRGASVRSPS